VISKYGSYYPVPGFAGSLENTLQYPERGMDQRDAIAVNVFCSVIGPLVLQHPEYIDDSGRRKQLYQKVLMLVDEFIDYVNFPVV
jgi:hypothetical protein